MKITNFGQWRRSRRAGHLLKITGEKGPSDVDNDQLIELGRERDALDTTADYEAVWAMAEALTLEGDMAKELADCDDLIDKQFADQRAWYRYPPIWVAACCLLVFSGLLVFTYRQLIPTGYSTDIGEQRRLVLEDGSRVTLNTDTEITIKLGAIRRINLIKGEAFFDVSRDPGRPFVVNTPAGQAQALGTEFSVRLDESRTRVTVVEGVVAVKGKDISGSAPKLNAGESLVLLNDGTPIPKETVDTTAIQYWREGKIYFKNQRLDTSVMEFNRYLERKLVVGTRELNDLRIGGVFEIGDVDAFLFALNEVFNIDAIETANATVLVRR